MLLDDDLLAKMKAIAEQACGNAHSPYGRFPVGAAVLMGIVSTVILFTYGILATTNADLFWSLFAFSAVIFLLPYIGLVLAFREMRRNDPERERPFRVPGSPFVANLLSLVCAAILAIAIFFFVYTPDEGMQWPVFAGAAAVLLLGEIVIRYAETHRAGG